MALSIAISAHPDAVVRRDFVLAGGRPEAVVEFEHQVVDFFVSAADLLGVPKSVAAIYGIVFASAEPLGFADIEARLNLSKGSVSQGLRILREIGALKAVGDDANPGSGSGNSVRGVSYEPDLELRKLI